MLESLSLSPFVGSYFCQQQKGPAVQTKKSKSLYTVVVEFENGMTRSIKVKASSRELAETRALKFNPKAKGVKRNA